MSYQYPGYSPFGRSLPAHPPPFVEPPPGAVYRPPVVIHKNDHNSDCQDKHNNGSNCQDRDQQGHCSYPDKNSNQGHK
ncbi:hypothetical protein RB195_004135 [Necator americanus]|uniref:Uncharacterized protein n=1 Tax=Necator americanus TaxID=51031 RepID=A0ABR1BIA8_NECAM